MCAARTPQARPVAHHQRRRAASGGAAQYSLICGERGQILDDIIVYNLGDQLLLVVNASNRLKILAWIDEQRGAAGRLDVPSTTPRSRRR